MARRTCTRCGREEPTYIYDSHCPADPDGVKHCVLEDTPCGFSSHQDAEDYRARGRAVTIADKRAIVERLLAAWLQMPTQRLGQLISNAFARATTDPTALGLTLFYSEDRRLLQLIEALTTQKENPQ